MEEGIGRFVGSKGHGGGEILVQDVYRRGLCGGNACLQKEGFPAKHVTTEDAETRSRKGRPDSSKSLASQQNEETNQSKA